MSASADIVRSACSSDPSAALAADPALARADLACACVTGDAAEVRRRVAAEPGVVGAALAPFGWQPLSYACFSRLLRADPVRADGIVEVARILLDAGADPNVGWEHEGWLELPLFGACGVANHAGLTRLLLAHGADPDETLTEPDAVGECLYHGIEFPELECARLLLEAGLTPHRVSACLGRALDFPEPDKVELLLAFGARPGSGRLHTAAFRRRPPHTLELLLDAGAEVDERSDGDTALQLVARWGLDEHAALLTGRGAEPARVTEADRALGAVVRGVGGSAPPGRVAAGMLEWAAHSGDATVVARLLDAGVPVDGDPREEIPPLGQACWRGHRAVAEVFLTRGAKLTWGDGGAVGAAVHGSHHCHHPEAGPTMQLDAEVTHGDYPGLLRALLGAGAPLPAPGRFDLAAEFARLGV